MDYRTTLLMSGFITHDTRSFILSRPDGFDWTPGQGVKLLLDDPDWDGPQGKPFTPTSRINDKVLEFIIKRYTSHHGFTERFFGLKPGKDLQLSEPFGTITYQGKGTFIAAGAGITPFLAIFRDLADKEDLSGNSLIYSSKTPADVICENELRYYFGNRSIFTCTRETCPGFSDERIDYDFLKEEIASLDQQFYVCGPPSFVQDVRKILGELGTDSSALIFEN
jgi:cytochrome-b5 reductase